jgi:hypothetical protein
VVRGEMVAFYCLLSFIVGFVIAALGCEHKSEEYIKKSDFEAMRVILERLK